jgi:integrase
MSILRLDKKESEFLFRNMMKDKKTGEWKGISHAERLFREHFKRTISRTTIYKLIEMYPEGVVEKAKKIEPRYVTEFEATEAWQRLKDHKYAKTIKPILLTAWRLLKRDDKYVEPLDWTVEDIKLLRSPMIHGHDNSLYILLTKDIYPEAAVNLRRAFHALSLYDLEKPLEMVPKRPAGVRKQWYLENDEIVKLINGINEPDILLFVVLDLQCGARPSSMVETRVNDINFERTYVQYYESKTKLYVERFFISETMTLLRRYISDRGLKMSDKLFPKNQMIYSDLLKEIGEKQGIEKLIVKGAGAYLLRHTFATQASEHDVSMEVVMKQGAWTDAKTVMDHYMFVKTSKMRRELLGEVVEKPKNFGEWIRQFVPFWEKRYLEIRAVK